MADSITTKQALACALKELLEDQSFDKISVSDICERCNMNRKSFYYHFRDKYDLVNWIFDTEFLSLVQDNLDDTIQSYLFDDRWCTLETHCRYFYENRQFYRKVLTIDGQNSLSAHFRELLYPILRLRVEELLHQEEVPQMVYDFVADGVISSIERWLLDKNCAPVEEFMYNLKKLVQILFMGINKRISDDPSWLE